MTTGVGHPGAFAHRGSLNRQACRAIPALALLAAIACGKPPAFDLAATRAVIVAQNARFTQAHVTGDSTTIDSMFMPDARSLPPGGEAIVGLPAIHALTVEYLRAGVSAFTEETVDFYGTADYVVDQGTYVMTYGTPPVTERGKYLNVWRQVNGHWKIQTNIWNTSSPPTAPTATSADNRTAFATRYAAAWSGKDPVAFGAFYHENASLIVNGSASVGRAAIVSTARAYMEAFPDMKVTLDSLREESGTTVFHWTWTGTNTGPGGTGRAVRLNGYERWTFAEDGRLMHSDGHFDNVEYQRQLKGEPAARR